jgi:hypothetical protein
VEAIGHLDALADELLSVIDQQTQVMVLMVGS